MTTPENSTNLSILKAAQTSLIYPRLTAPAVSADFFVPGIQQFGESKAMLS